MIQSAHYERILDKSEPDGCEYHCFDSESINTVASRRSVAEQLGGHGSKEEKLAEVSNDEGA